MTQVVNFKGQHGGAAKGCLIAAVILLLLAGGGGWLAWNKMQSVAGEELIRAIQEDPAVQEHIGTIEEAKMNLVALAKYAEQQGKKSGEKHSVMIFDITGTKGKGRVITRMDGQTAEGSAEVFHSAVLDMGGGKTFQLSINGNPPAPTPEKAPEAAPEKAPEPAGAGK